MALTLKIETEKAVEFEEGLELLDRRLDPDDYDGLAEAAITLKQLANNRRFLIEHVNASLRNRQSEKNNAIGDTAFFLARKGRVFIRANVWAPPKEAAASRRWQANIRSYLTPHDHPFSFITVGYFGPGYKTTIFEYDRTHVKGELGEQVALQPLETTTLPEGKVMIYRASKDVHFQDHPEKFSISLNLMVYPDKDRDQYGFDIAHSRITARAVDFRSTQGMLCQMASALGDKKTSNILEEVAIKSSDREIRLNALVAWSQLEPTRSRDIWTVALSDPHDEIRASAKAKLAGVA
jgi:hypothetical protein